MAGKDNTGKIILFMIAGGVVSVVALSCWLLFSPAKPVAQIDFDNYTPSPGFSLAYSALHEASGKSEAKNVPVKAPVMLPVTLDEAETEGDSARPSADKPSSEAAKAVDATDGALQPVEPVEMRPSDFNVERTYRIIRGLEIAQQECGDWMTFVKYLARQDYRGVPAEVIEAQARLLPILERIHEVEEELGEHSGALAVLNALGQGVATVADNLDLTAIASAMGGGAFMNPRTRVMFEKGYNAALESYKASGSKRKEIARQLREVQLAYVRYLATYVPIRRKYEQEWDAMCLAKDKAYIQVGGGNWESAADTARQILKNYPYDRESVVLCALSLSRMALADARAASEKIAEPDGDMADFQPDDAVLSDIVPAKKPVQTIVPPDDPRIVEAQSLLADYLKLHPDSAAPALVVLGLVKSMTGDVRGSMEALDQSSIEYPREAAKLADMLEAYASRPYLEKTAEGQRLLGLHRSLCEGFGAFSPNLEKAFVYEREGDYKKAKEEIFNHFFRRSNQESIHELVTDMDFCERNLSVGFKGLLMEHSYLDVDFGQVRNAATLGMTAKEGLVQISLLNRADFELRNVRLFLCVQFTGMYKGEYDILRAGSVGVLKPGERYEFPATPLGRKDKSFKDISNVRAIAMTDDKICWVDTVRAKRAHAINISAGFDKLDLPFTPAEYLASFGMDAARLARMAAEAPVVFESRIWPKSDAIEVSLPRIFAVLDPVFTIGEIGSDECVYPDENRVAGSKITLRFPVKLKDSATCDLCVYSDYGSIRIKLRREGKDVKVEDVSRLAPLKRE